LKPSAIPVYRHVEAYWRVEVIDDDRTEVAIVGAGLSGLALAIALRRKDITPIVLDQNAVLQKRVGEVLPPAVIKPLVELGIWDSFVSQGHFPSAGVSVWWGAPERRDWDYIRLPYGHGWHIDRLRFSDLLRQTAIQAGALLRLGTKVLRFETCNDGSWEVICRDIHGTTRGYRADFLVNATGRGRALSYLTGPRIRYDRLVGAATYFLRSGNQLSSEPRLWVETTPKGWWYTAPLPANKLVAVFLTDPDELRRSPSRSGLEGFIRPAEWTRRRLVGCVPITETQISSADTGRATCFAGSGFMAIGDAAFSTDPIRGIGVLNAIEQGSKAADAIIDYLEGSGQALREFADSLEEKFATT
jgi:flavin-dependent dehydrogenase